MTSTKAELALGPVPSCNHGTTTIKRLSHGSTRHQRQSEQEKKQGQRFSRPAHSDAKRWGDRAAYMKEFGLLLPLPGREDVAKDETNSCQTSGGVRNSTARGRSTTSRVGELREGRPAVSVKRLPLKKLDFPDPFLPTARQRPGVSVTAVRGDEKNSPTTLCPGLKGSMTVCSL